MATAEFAGDCGRLHDQQGRGERRDKANAAQGVAKHGAADMDQEGDEWIFVFPIPERNYAAIIWFLIAYRTSSALLLQFKISMIRYL